MGLSLSRFQMTFGLSTTRACRRLAVVFALVAAPATAADQPVGAPIGDWRVVADVDPMTDKKNCTAILGARGVVQLSARSFAVSYRGRGGLKGYTIRFDDDPPLGTALPTRIEERIGALVIDSTDPRYERLKSARRVRIQALTVLSTLVNDDVDLSRLAEVVARLDGPGCN